MPQPLVPVLYVLYDMGKPLNLAKGDDEKELLRQCKQQHPAAVELSLVPAHECPVDHVALVAMCLLGEWLIMQFSMVQQMQAAAGRKVQPVGRM